jgi:hypothetical protein
MKKIGKLRSVICITQSICVVVIVVLLPFVASFDQCRLKLSLVIPKTGISLRHNNHDLILLGSKRTNIELYGQQQQQQQEQQHKQQHQKQQQQQQQQQSIDNRMKTMYFDFTSSFVFATRSPLLAITANHLKSRTNYNTRTSYPQGIAMSYNNNDNNNDSNEDDEDSEIQQDRVDEYLEFLERRYK